MEGTYCGKDCAACLYREAENCPGCAAGPGSARGNCAVARCCREKGNSSCETCTLSDGCSTLRAAPMEPEYRAKRRRDAEEARERLGRDAALLAVKLNTLFVLLLVSTMASVVISVMGTLSLGDGADTLSTLLSYGVNIAYACILLTLGGVNPRFRKAAVMSLAGAGLGLAGWFFQGAAVLFALISVILGALLVFAASVAALAVYIVQLVYLSRTAKIFTAAARG